MPGADGLLNHTYDSLAQGVSQQTVEARRESQVEVMENCIPHISRGILRRNPLQHGFALLDKDGVALVPRDYFTYTYDRGTSGEKYLVLVGDQEWYVYNADPDSVNYGDLVGAYNDTLNAGHSLAYLNTNGKDPKEVFSLVTVGDFTWIANSEITTALTSYRDSRIEDYHKTTCLYWVQSTGNVVTSTDSTTGDATIKGYEYNMDVDYNLSGYAIIADSATVQGGNATTELLTGDQIAAEVVTQLNTGHSAISGTYIVETPEYKNGWINPEQNCFVAYDSSTSKYTYVWNGETVAITTSTSPTIGTYTYEVNGASKWVFGTSTFYAIKRKYPIPNTSDPANGLWTAEGSFVYKTGLPTATKFRFSDSIGNRASYGIQGTVPSSDKLPASVPDGCGDLLVKVVGTGSDTSGDEYWLEWTKGHWKESRAPAMYNDIDASTMPHVFQRGADGAFTFGWYGEWDNSDSANPNEHTKSNAWASRKVGDLLTAPAPSFIGRKISHLFVHNNRFGVLAEDAVVLSQFGEYANFWPTTIRSIPASDPIDLVVATTDVTGLKTAVSLSGLLLLFSDRAQFALLSGTTAALSPETAMIVNVSSYNYKDTAPAIVVGNKVLFLSESGSNTQQFAFQTGSLSSSVETIQADPTSLHIPNYLPTGISYMVSHSILGYIFMLSPTSNQELYVLNTTDLGGSNVQSAYHKWTFGVPIKGISILNNILNMVYSYNAELFYGTIALDLPTDWWSSGFYLDTYKPGGYYAQFVSRVALSKWFVRDGNGIGNRRGRLQIRSAEFSVGDYDTFKVRVTNDEIFQPNPYATTWILEDATWNDSYWWAYLHDQGIDDDDIVYWKDGIPYYSREYTDDSKVTISGNSRNTNIEFLSYNNFGFNLQTVNMEGMWRQRSMRV